MSTDDTRFHFDERTTRYEEDTRFTEDETSTQFRGSEAGSRFYSPLDAGPPVIINPGDQENEHNDVVNLRLQLDQGTQPVVWTNIGDPLPPDLELGFNSGVISGTISPLGPVQTYNIVVRATNAEGDDTAGFAWAISYQSPAIVDPGPQIVDHNEAVDLVLVYRGTGTLVWSDDNNLPPGLALDQFGRISGTVSPSADSSYDSEITLTNEVGSDSIVINWTVRLELPTITNPGPQSNTHRDIVSLQIESTSGTGTLVWSAQDLPLGLSIASDIGLISGTIDDEADLAQTSVVRLDNARGFDTVAFAWDVSPVSPSIVNPGPQSVTHNEVVNLSIDFDGTGTLVFSAVDLPHDLSIDKDTGIISGTINPLAAPTYNSTIRLDNEVGFDEVAVVWTVSVESPVIDDPGPQSVTHNEVVFLQMTLSAGTGQLSWSALSLPPDLDIDKDTGIISGTVNPSASPLYESTVSVSNEAGSDDIAITWNVSLQPPIIIDPGTQNVEHLEIISLQLELSEGSGTISWSDDTNLPPDLSLATGTGLISGTINTIADPLYVSTITASNAAGSDNVDITWNVATIIPLVDYLFDQFNFEGEAALITPSLLQGTGTVTWSYSGILPSGLDFDTGTGTISGILTEPAQFEEILTVRATNAAGFSEQSFIWTVRDACVQALDNAPLFGTPPTSWSEFGGPSVKRDTQSSNYDAHYITEQNNYLEQTINLPTGDYHISVYLDDIVDQPSSTPLAIAEVTGSGSWSTPPNTPPYTRGQLSGIYSVTASGTFTLSFGNGNNNTGEYTISRPMAAPETASASFHSSCLLIQGTVVVRSASMIWCPTSPAPADPPVLINPGAQSSQHNEVVSLQLETSSGTPPFVWTSVGDPLPDGLTLGSSTGLISGTVDPIAAITTSNITIQAENTAGSDQTSFNWEVLAETPVIDDPGPQSVDTLEVVSLQMTASAGTGTLTWSAINLPTGLSIHPSTGLISGTVSINAETILSTVTLTNESDSDNVDINWTVTPTVEPPVLINPGNQSNGQGDPVNLQIGITSGTEPFTWTSIGDPLPLGLSLDSETGLISGTVDESAAIDTSVITILAENAAGTDSVTFDWEITAPVVDTAIQLNHVSAQYLSRAAAVEPHGLVHPLTLAAWTWTTRSALQQILGTWSSTSGVRYQALLWNTNGRLGVVSRGPGSNTIYTPLSGYHDNLWHLIVGIFEESEVRFSIDGGPLNVSSVGPNPLSDTDGLNVGRVRNDETTYMLSGGVDEGGIWSNRAFSEGDIAELWNGGAGHLFNELSANLQTNLAYWFPFSETQPGGIGTDAVARRDLSVFNGPIVTIDGFRTPRDIVLVE